MPEVTGKSGRGQSLGGDWVAAGWESGTSIFTDMYIPTPTVTAERKQKLTLGEAESASWDLRCEVPS